MTNGDFVTYVSQAAELVDSYWRSLAAGDLPVTPDHAPGDTSAALPRTAPRKGEPLEEILADTSRLIIPGLVHWQHPDFLGYYPTANSPASVIAELVTAGLGVQGMMWSTSPAATELEQTVTDWLAHALGLPEHFQHSHAGAHARGTGTVAGGAVIAGGGVIQDSASSAALVATVAGLYRASDGLWRTHGVEGDYRLYCTDQANSAIPKAARIAGLGEPTLVPTTPGTCRMDPEALRAQLDADRRAGRVPAVVMATIGTTATCAVDPIAAIGAICEEYGVWLHVDAAYAGSAAICPEFQYINEGVHLADSYAVNPHKWMRTGMSCDVMWTSDRAALTEAMHITPSFLRNSASDGGQVVDFRDWQVPLGRPMRALKLWYVMRAEGVEGLQAAIRNDVALAASLARAVSEEPGFHLVAHHLGLVAFRRDTDEQTRELADRLNRDGKVFCTPAVIDGRQALRAAVGSRFTTQVTIDEAWDRVCGMAEVEASEESGGSREDGAGRVGAVDPAGGGAVGAAGSAGPVGSAGCAGFVDSAGPAGSVGSADGEEELASR